MALPVAMALTYLPEGNFALPSEAGKAGGNPGRWRAALCTFLCISNQIRAQALQVGVYGVILYQKGASSFMIIRVTPLQHPNTVGI